LAHKLVQLNQEFAGAGPVEQDVRAFIQRLGQRRTLQAVMPFASRARGGGWPSSAGGLRVRSEELAGVPHLTRLARLVAAWAEAAPLPPDALALMPDELEQRAQDLSVAGQMARQGVMVSRAAGWVGPRARPAEEAKSDGSASGERSPARAAGGSGGAPGRPGAPRSRRCDPWACPVGPSGPWTGRRAPRASTMPQPSNAFYAQSGGPTDVISGACGLPTPGS